MLRQENPGVVDAQGPIHVLGSEGLLQPTPIDGFADAAHCGSIHPYDYPSWLRSGQRGWW